MCRIQMVSGNYEVPYSAPGWLVVPTRDVHTPSLSILKLEEVLLPIPNKWISVRSLLHVHMHKHIRISQLIIAYIPGVSQVWKPIEISSKMKKIGMRSYVTFLLVTLNLSLILNLTVNLTFWIENPIFGKFWKILRS